jgi:hypothetical protein
MNYFRVGIRSILLLSNLSYNVCLWLSFEEQNLKWVVSLSAFDYIILKIELV